MAKFYTELNDGLKQFIAAQHVFFNASAPNEGRLNVSPKGLDTFRILNDKQVAYLDLTGSENETAAHVAENGRLTLMFCSFEDKPSILRLYGKGGWCFPVILNGRNYILSFRRSPARDRSCCWTSNPS